jgi:hypothetical protein
MKYGNVFQTNLSEYFFNLKLSFETQESYAMSDRRIPPRFNWIIRSSGLLRCVKWFETDVSGLPIDPIFKGQEDGTDR